MARSVTAFFLGGTISMADTAGGATARLGADELVAAVPQIADLGISLDARQLRLVPSGSLTFADIAELVHLASDLEADGIVVVQGTDTLEETAYLIDLLWPGDTPVVVTGAMRNASLPGPDGSANLLAATIVAASDCFRGLGALVVLNDEVHAARYARKTHTISTGTFASPTFGPLGHLVEGVAVPVTTVSRRRTYALPGFASARVALVAIGLDDGGEAFDGLAERYDGAVLLAYGGGHVPPWLVSAIASLAERVPVVLASRTPSGPTLASTYGYPGSETDLLSRGLIRAGYLDPFKARVLLRVLLSNDYEIADIHEAFAEASGMPRR